MKARNKTKGKVADTKLVYGSLLILLLLVAYTLIVDPLDHFVTYFLLSPILSDNMIVKLLYMPLLLLVPVSVFFAPYCIYNLLKNTVRLRLRSKLLDVFICSLCLLLGTVFLVIPNAPEIIPEALGGELTSIKLLFAIIFVMIYCSIGMYYRHVNNLLPEKEFHPAIHRLAIVGVVSIIVFLVGVATTFST